MKKLVCFLALLGSVALAARPNGLIIYFGTVMQNNVYVRIPRECSHFSLIPFAYGQFAPLFSSVLACLLLVMVTMFSFVCHVPPRVAKTAFFMSLAAFLALLLDIAVWFGGEPPTATGVGIRVLLGLACLMFLGIWETSQD